MSEPASAANQDTQRIFQHFIAQHDGPAYLRRARRLDDAIKVLHERCRRQREEWLLMPRLHLGRLQVLAGNWEHLRPLLRDDEQVASLRRLHADLAPRLRLPPEPTTSMRKWRQALWAVIESNQRFNARWQTFVGELDFIEINALVDGYNRYYLLEKECVVTSPRIARMGFEPKRFMTVNDVLAAWPLLTVPAVG